MPVAPKTPLCLFVNTYTGEMFDEKTGKTVPDPAVKANPKLLGEIAPLGHHWFRCTNYSGTKFNISPKSIDATDFVGTPFNNYVEMNAYVNKMAAIFQKEVLSKVGKKK